LTVGLRGPVRPCDLQVITLGMPGLTPALGGVFAEAAAVCLEHNKHNPGVHLLSDGKFPCSFSMVWQPASAQQIRSHSDLQDATEFGACAIAIFVVRDQTGQVVVERSCKGTGFDFWLGAEDDLLFKNKARLEVSGILEGGESEIATRVTKKLNQLSRSDGILPGYVAVVEFSGPRVRVVVK
jgi:hypothetical protein